MKYGLTPRGLQLANLVVYSLASLLALIPPAMAHGSEPLNAGGQLFEAYCFDCHNNDAAEAGVNLEKLSADADFGRAFKDWEKVTRMLRDGKMPPEEMPQPSEAERAAMIQAIDQGLDQYIAAHAGDPGPVVMRRLTSAEYAYTIEDLTGLQLNVAEGFVSDAAGGEGFTNVGGAQFMQDSTLERYLEAAKTVASHAVIGAGPLEFFADPGQTGRELSAITRIQQIYREHGFRTAAGEGAEPFGLDLYPRALFVAWQYHFREKLGLRETTITDLANREDISARLCSHVWDVVNRDRLPFPLSSIVSQWREVPPPPDASESDARSLFEDLGYVIREWQGMLAAAAGDEEEAAVLTAGDVQVAPSHSFRADINWAAGAEVAEFEISLSRASDDSIAGALVHWKNARVRFQREDRRRDRYRPLGELVTTDTAARLKFGSHPHGADIGPHDFVLAGAVTVPVVLRIPPGRIAAEMVVDVALDLRHGEQCIVRCRIADGEVEGETAAEVGATSTLLADPTDPRVVDWQTDVAQFARLMPEVSHREPAPSDRDPIPAPFDNTYNLPERNHFHYAIKYHRDDAFFVQHIADDATRRKLDQAWTDLLTSFEYHDANLRFTNKKYSLGLDDPGIAELDQATIDRLPAEPGAFIKRWSEESQAMREALRAAETGHVEDALQFAAAAWRRPLTTEEQRRLREFYAMLRRERRLNHELAIRALLARVLVAPAFLYRAEPLDEQEGIVPLSDWQLASRLSYFLWSSAPDVELSRLAAANQLHEPSRLAAQTRRMLRDPKARRLAAEFFGQWLGFYRFDTFRGVDAGRFPEFTDGLKTAMHEEAVAFFAHIIREDQPPGEILWSDYTFLNRRLAEHYGISHDGLAEEEFARIDGLAGDHRGGLLGLSAVLTATSAPLRTSAVKRGDWVLRRVVGTPVPPPPADAGSIAADDVTGDGLTVRARLEAHRREATCVNCHARIDPLGFALENYDILGRWRETYRDGSPIDASGVLSDGAKVSGPAGLRDYLRREQAKFYRTLCTKLLGYALGRPEMASDRPLIQSMMGDVRRDGRFSDLAVRIVSGRQFLSQRAAPVADAGDEPRREGEHE